MIESFSESKNLARVTAGFKGGPFFKNPVLAPALNIVDGYPPEVDEKMQSKPAAKIGTPIDMWGDRNRAGK